MHLGPQVCDTGTFFGFFDKTSLSDKRLTSNKGNIFMASEANVSTHIEPTTNTTFIDVGDSDAWQWYIVMIC